MNDDDLKNWAVNELIIDIALYILYNVLHYKPNGYKDLPKVRKHIHEIYVWLEKNYAGETRNKIVRDIKQKQKLHEINKDFK